MQPGLGGISFAGGGALSPLDKAVTDIFAGTVLLAGAAELGPVAQFILASLRTLSLEGFTSLLTNIERPWALNYLASGQVVRDGVLVSIVGSGMESDVFIPLGAVPVPGSGQIASLLEQTLRMRSLAILADKLDQSPANFLNQNERQSQ